MIIKYADFIRDHPKPGHQYRMMTHEETARIRSRIPAHKLPASEYTRIMLAAKDGSLAPGEADRRIVRKGGRVSINPLPRMG